jgi:hypothetical protein
MSDSIDHTPAQESATPSRRGQGLVELALVLPLLLLLLLGAIDFGRVFFGWVAVTNASRVGANYAATHPDAWATSNAAQQDEYQRLIQDSGANNCDLYESTDPPAPAFPDGGRDLGDRVRVDLECEFNMVNPVLGPWTGPITISASATFNVRRGCVDCASLAAGPAPPPQNHCRLTPNMVGLSVTGAKLQWESAGFTGAFEPVSADGWRTVTSKTVDQGDEIGCDLPYAFFTSSVYVTLAVIVEPTGADTCKTVPNVLGMTVNDARLAWEDADFEPARFAPASGADDQIVSSVSYTPATASHGECHEPDALDIEVQYVAPPAAPPVPPCKVPSFVNTPREDAPAKWTAAEFSGSITYQGGSWTTITKQDLVGGSYVACSSSIKLSK